MPTYDYECTVCGHTFEEFQSMSERPLSKCPECGKKVQRLIGGGIGVIFKGSGFYSTDSKKGGTGKPAAAGEGSKTGDGKNGEKKNDVKGTDSKGTDSKGTDTKKDSSSETAGKEKKKTA